MLAHNIDVDLTDEHWKAIRFLREDYKTTGETADDAPRPDRRRHPRQGAVRALPQEAGQEDGLRRRPAQAARLRVTTATRGPCHDYRPGRHRPSFDDDASAGRKLAIICSKGNLDMAYPGLILANAALGEGVETHLFFTFWGFDMITKSRMHDLKFTPVGNTATHLPMGITPFPGMTGTGDPPAEEVDRRPRRARGPGVPRADRRGRAVTCGPAGSAPT